MLGLTTTKPRARRLPALVVTAATVGLIAAACGSGSSGGGGTSGSNQPANPLTNPAGDKSFAIALPAEPGFSDLPMLAANDKLNAAGWHITTQIYSDQALQTQANINGKAALSRGNPLAALIAVQQGASLPLVMQGGPDDWIIVASGGITSCKQFTGKKVGYQSASSLSTYMLKAYVNSCGAKPNYFLMDGSANRAAAMISGVLDATIVQIGDWIPATQTRSTDAHILSNVAETLPGLTTNAWSANPNWLKQNPDVAAAYLANLLQEARNFDTDHASLVTAANKYLRGQNADETNATIDAFHGKPFSEDGTLTPKAVKFTIQFAQQSQAILGTPITYQDAVDPTPVTAAKQVLTTGS